jgi:hypothetical protein
MVPENGDICQDVCDLNKLLGNPYLPSPPEIGTTKFFWVCKQGVKWLALSCLKLGAGKMKINSEQGQTRKLPAYTYSQHLAILLAQRELLTDPWTSNSLNKLYKAQWDYSRKTPIPIEFYTPMRSLWIHSCTWQWASWDLTYSPSLRLWEFIYSCLALPRARTSLLL